MAGILILAVLAAASQDFPEVGAIASGLVPGISDDFDIEFLLPWLGFILAGAAGIMWFSYLVAAREYGGPVEDSADSDQAFSDLPNYEADDDFQQRRRDRLQRWMRIMSTTALVGVVGDGLVIVAFMILGTELLQPEGIVPEGIAVAEDLTRLLSEVWGAFGYWLLIVSIVIALGGTIVANQDGWPRTFADATLILAGDRLNPHRGAGNSPQGRQRPDWNEPPRWRRWLADREAPKNIYVITTVTLLPLVVFFWVRDPVNILEVGGIVAAVHTPVIVGLTLYLNKTKLPQDLQPGWLAAPAMVLSGLFFTVVAVLYFMIELFGMEL